MTVTYEWDIEEIVDGDTVDMEDGEIIDHWHHDSYAGCLEFIERNPPEPGIRYEIVLVRDTDTDRCWAYVEDGKLPSHFQDAYNVDTVVVPLRFHKELNCVNNEE